MPEFVRAATAWKNTGFATSNGVLESGDRATSGTRHPAPRRPARGGWLLVVRTGQFTGRSPKDKFIVRDETTEATCNGAPVNQPMSEAHFDRLYRECWPSGRGTKLFVQDCFAGADPPYTLPIRVITQYAWHSLFARQLFIRAGPCTTGDHVPEFTILFAPDFQANPAEDGTNSETCIVINFKKRVVLICGTSYAGEMKKSVFTILNYLLPERGVFPMHCSANIGRGRRRGAVLRPLRHRQDHAFRRSEPPPDRRRRARLERQRRLQFRRRLLRQVHPPLPRRRSRRSGTPSASARCWKTWPWMRTRALLDFDSDELTENTRAAYPLEFIDNAVIPSVGGHPDQRHLPDRRCLRRAAAHFAADARAGHVSLPERLHRQGRRHRARASAKSRRPPSAPVSARRSCRVRRPPTPRCWARKCGRTRLACWLVNTGWAGGPFGVGERMKLRYTRAMLNAALDGRTEEHVPMSAHPVFSVAVPKACPGVPRQFPGCPRHVGRQSRLRQSRARPERPLQQELRKVHQRQTRDRGRRPVG